jgi:hypothetical protein
VSLSAPLGPAVELVGLSFIRSVVGPVEPGIGLEGGPSYFTDIDPTDESLVRTTSLFEELPFLSEE